MSMPLITVQTISQGQTAQGLVNLLLTAVPQLSVVPGSALFQGDTLQAGSFINGKRTIVPPDPGHNIASVVLGSGLTTDDGVALATGRLFLTGSTRIIGGFAAATTNYSDNLGVSNQAFALPIATINGVANTLVHDPCSLKFSFIPTANQFRFSFWFLSFEYPEFVGSPFTDTFLALLDGVNVALIPGTSTFISINNVNSGTLPSWVVQGIGQFLSGTGWQQLAGHGLVCDNRGGATAGVDGLGNWLPVTITLPVTVGQTYTLEFLLADLADGNIESAVLFPARSMSAGTGLDFQTDSGGGAGCAVAMDDTWRLTP